jgi:hypothetical protein
MVSRAAPLRDAARARTVPPMAEAETAYHLHLTPGEPKLVVLALRLLQDDMAHTPVVRRPARRVLNRVETADEPTPEEPLVLALDAPELKVLHTALRILYDDLGREDADERSRVGGQIDKLPDEHAIRAIEL